MMRPWTPRRRLALATNCLICRSPTCDRKDATDAKNAADAAFTAAIVGRLDRTGLYDALQDAYARLDRAWNMCRAPGRHMDIFIAAMKATQYKRRAFERAISEGVRQSMQPKQCGATMLCMRGAR